MRADSQRVSASARFVACPSTIPAGNDRGEDFAQDSRRAPRVEDGAKVPT